MLQLSHLSKTFNQLKAVNDISLTLQTGEILVVLGPSGCGKSTLLSLIAGLIEPDAGEVKWNHETITGLPTHQRNFGLMFQDYALFPHLNVEDNVAFGLTSIETTRRVTSNDGEVEQILKRVGLSGFEKRDVQTLSGGEQQRVALARALAPRPRLLMLDEPLGALDRTLREQLTHELRALLQEFKQTAIYVTHDQQEAFAIADQIAIMNQGSFVQLDTPEDVFRNPADEFTKGFLKRSVLVEGKVEEERLMIKDWGLDVSQWDVKEGEQITLLVKAEGVRRK